MKNYMISVCAMIEDLKALNAIIVNDKTGFMLPMPCVIGNKKTVGFNFIAEGLNLFAVVDLSKDEGGMLEFSCESPVMDIEALNRIVAVLSNRLNSHVYAVAGRYDANSHDFYSTKVFNKGKQCKDEVASLFDPSDMLQSNHKFERYCDSKYGAQNIKYYKDNFKQWKKQFMV